MCGLAGVIFGRKRRRAEEREHLAWLFTRLLVMSEGRGPHATGVAWLNRDGEHRLFKRPVSAGQFVIDKTFHEVLAGIDNRTTVLLGHTRWRTRGDERINRNNHPIRAGDVIGTHNGTIYNADYLFRRFKLRRFAQVDSELLFRLAARAARSGQMDVEWFKERLRRCRGQKRRCSHPGSTPRPSSCSRGTSRSSSASTGVIGRCSTHPIRPSWVPSSPRNAAGGNSLSPP